MNKSGGRRKWLKLVSVRQVEGAGVQHLVSSPCFGIKPFITTDTGEISSSYTLWLYLRPLRKLHWHAYTHFYSNPASSHPEISVSGLNTQSLQWPNGTFSIKISMGLQLLQGSVFSFDGPLFLRNSFTRFFTLPARIVFERRHGGMGGGGGCSLPYVVWAP